MVPVDVIRAAWPIASSPWSTASADAACTWHFPQLRCARRRAREPRPRDRQGSGL